jgi:hypothetical protein
VPTAWFEPATPVSERPQTHASDRAATGTGYLYYHSPTRKETSYSDRKILMFIYPIYNHNWKNISTIYIYITRLASNEIFSPSNKIHREVGRAKDLYIYIYIKVNI